MGEDKERRMKLEHLAQEIRLAQDSYREALIRKIRAESDLERLTTIVQERINKLVDAGAVS